MWLCSKKLNRMKMVEAFSNCVWLSRSRYVRLEGEFYYLGFSNFLKLARLWLFLFW